MKEYSDAQVNDCAERLSQLGIPVNGSTNPKVGYIKNPMACERCVYGSGEHAEWCEQHPQYEMNYACAVGRGYIAIVDGHVLMPGETIAEIVKQAVERGEITATISE